MSILRNPRIVGDRALLEDEPFKSFFPGAPRPSRREFVGGVVEKNLCEMVVENMKGPEHGLDAARLWLEAVFGIQPEDITDKELVLFVQFFRYMYLDKPQDAHKFMRKERIARHFTTCPQLDTLIADARATASSEIASRNASRRATSKHGASSSQRASEANIARNSETTGKRTRRSKRKTNRDTPESSGSRLSEPHTLSSSDLHAHHSSGSESDEPMANILKKRRGCHLSVTPEDTVVVESVEKEPVYPLTPLLLSSSTTEATDSVFSLSPNSSERTGLHRTPRASRKPTSRKMKEKKLSSLRVDRPKKKRRGLDSLPLADDDYAQSKPVKKPLVPPRRLVTRYLLRMSPAEKQARSISPSAFSVNAVSEVPRGSAPTRKRRACSPDTIDAVPPRPLGEYAPCLRLIAPLPPTKARPIIIPRLPSGSANRFTQIDHQLRLAAAEGLYLHNSTDPAAEEWRTEEPDTQQPGTTNDVHDDISSNPITYDEDVLQYPPLPGETLTDPNAPVQQDTPQDSVVLASQTLISMKSEPPEEPVMLPCPAPYANFAPCPLFESAASTTEMPKPHLPAYPPIWAESRQEVCESFDWFRSYQGGVYFVNGLVKGYMLGGFSASRDIFHRGGKLIVSHGGGKAAQTLGKEKKATVEAGDQLENDTSVKALLRNYREKRPMALIIDDNYALFPYDLAAKGCTYAVLGWYQIVQAWAEYQSDPGSRGKVIRYKFAFQWCEGQGEPWWWQSPDPSPELGMVTEPEDQKPILPYSCKSCGCESPIIYERPMCLKPNCPLFCCILTSEAPSLPVGYSSQFLRYHDIGSCELQDLKPPLPVDEELIDGITTSHHFVKGWHCPKCGRLSSRFKWEHWECRNCHETYHVEGGRCREAKEFRKQYTSNLKPQKTHASIIAQSPQKFFAGTLYVDRETYILPHDRGKIHLIRPPPLSSTEADELLKTYQEQAEKARDPQDKDGLGFRRWPLRAHKCRGTLLTNYFSQNTGEPYQYIGGDENTVRLDEAPSAPRDALQLIQTRIRQAGLSSITEFNEVLTAAYMEKQKMAFHSDAEKGLGPNVASLSLGASAHMYFRLHAKYSTDGTRDVLRLFLKHGDVLVMEGAGVQQYYEHTVIPLNFRIAATARFIGKDHC